MARAIRSSHGNVLGSDCEVKLNLCCGKRDGNGLLLGNPVSDDDMIDGGVNGSEWK